MTHLDEGTLQAFLDSEIPHTGRAAAAEHLLVCGECRRELDALKEANRLLADALADLDVATPTPAPPRARSRRRAAFGGASMTRAAVLVLFLAAAASATVPGSPVREWIVDVTRSAPADPPAADPEPVDAPAPEPAPPEPAGVGISGVSSLEVIVTGLADASIRLVRTDGPGIAVSARGGQDPLFRMGSGRIEVVGGSGGELVLEVPRVVGTVRLVVDGRPYAEVVGRDLTVIEPGERDGDTVVWR